MPRLQLVRGHIPWSAVDLQLQAGRSIWIATTRPDGRAMVAPVWYCWFPDADQPSLYFITARSTQKARTLNHREWVEAHLGHGDDVIILRGPARVTHDPEERRRVDAAYSARYVDPYSGARASIFDNPEDDLYRLRPERILAWYYGVVGTWTEWRLTAAGRSEANGTA